MTLLIVLGLAIASPGSAGARSTAEGRSGAEIGLDEHVGAKLPTDLVFTESTGGRIALGELLDGHRPVVLVMAYARCTMLCSVVLRGVAQAIHDGTADPGRDYLPVVVSLDPRETPDEGARRQNALLADIGRRDRSAWRYLVGDEPAIRGLADSLGFRYAWDPHTEQYAHPAVVFVVTPDGRIAEYVRGVTFDGLAAAIARARDGQLTPSTARDLLACFHFDPSLRRYERSLRLLFALGSGVVLIALVALVIALVRWERRRR